MFATIIQTVFIGGFFLAGVGLLINTITQDWED